jgi:hypothetical protein
MCVTLVTAFKRDEGSISTDLRKILYSRNDRCAYESLNVLTKDALTTVYEPIADDEETRYSQTMDGMPVLFHCKSGLNLDVIFSLAGEKETVAAATLLNSVNDKEQRPGAKMYVRADGSVIGTLGTEFLDTKIIPAAVEIIDTGRYRNITVPAETSTIGYSVLIEEIF